MKINLKKATSVLLAIIMVFSVFTIVPITASAVDNTEKVGVPLYQANIIANGYNNDGEGYYKLFKDLRDPLYYDFADYMLDDGHQIFGMQPLILIFKKIHHIFMK